MRRDSGSRAIVAGERDAAVLAAMKDVRIRASKEEIAKSLQGNWRAEHLFALKQALALFDFIGTQVAECDAELEAQLQRMQAYDGTPAKGKKRSRARNAPRFNLRELMFKMCGVDLTRIDGIDVTTALTVISEVGPDMSRFPTVKHFACWLGLCPGTRITGGKVMSSKTKRVANRADQALRLAAAALRTSQSALGAYFRRLCSRMDKPKAVTAAAHKLARLIYTMLPFGPHGMLESFGCDELPEKRSVISFATFRLHLGNHGRVVAGALQLKLGVLLGGVVSENGKNRTLSRLQRS